MGKTSSHYLSSPTKMLQRLQQSKMFGQMQLSNCVTGMFAVPSKLDWQKTRSHKNATQHLPKRSLTSSVKISYKQTLDLQVCQKILENFAQRSFVRRSKICWACISICTNSFLEKTGFFDQVQKFDPLPWRKCTISVNPEIWWMSGPICGHLGTDQKCGFYGHGQHMEKFHDWERPWFRKSLENN